jgi:hypothetical protein
MALVDKNTIIKLKAKYLCVCKLKQIYSLSDIKLLVSRSLFQTLHITVKRDHKLKS